MAAVVGFKTDLVDGLLCGRLVVGAMGVSLVEVTVGKAVFPKELDVLEDRAVIESVTRSVACKTRPGYVEWLSSTDSIDALICEVTTVFKAIGNSNVMRVINVVVCVGCLHIVNLTNDGICRFRRCGRGSIGARARGSTVVRARTSLRAVWPMCLWRRSMLQRRQTRFGFLKGGN